MRTQRLEDLFDRPRRRPVATSRSSRRTLAQALLEESVVDTAKTYCDQFETSKVALVASVALNFNMNKAAVESLAVDNEIRLNRE